MVVSDDIYKGDVDFTALAMQYADFSKKLKPNGQLDFSDPESVRQLTSALLQRDFNLSVDLPEDRLCPPVPNRFNYIVFIKKLIDSTRPDHQGHTHDDEKILGLDIGTGASAIYPLLACRQRPNWFFLGTEIDTRSREYAVKNVKANNLQSRIKIISAEDGEGATILPMSQLDQFDEYAVKIQMMNPPFYSSSKEMLDSARQKSRPPNSACTGAPVEMIIPGGEIYFVTRLIQESMTPTARTKIQWFSSMLGKSSSVGVIVDILREKGCSNYAVTEFVQGETRRWCVAWSWCMLRPPSSLARGINGGAVEKKFFPFPSDYDFEVDQTSLNPTVSHEQQQQQSAPTSVVKSVTDIINGEISKLDLQWTSISIDKGTSHTHAGHHGGQDKHVTSGIGKSGKGDVWSRKARRQLAKLGQNDTSMTDEHANTRAHVHAARAAYRSDEQSNEIEYDDGLPLAFQVEVKEPPYAGQSESTKSVVAVVNVRWLQGHDSVLFESFCGWLKRKVGSSQT